MSESSPQSPEVAETSPEPSPTSGKSHSSLEVFWVFLRLGCIAFGGPAAHLAYFRNELVQQRKWFSEQQFGTWLAICQFLPGPASSQMGLMLGLQRAGWKGGLAAFVAFTSPSVVLLMLFATLLPALDHPLGVALIHGLKLAACVIVADAVLGMAKSFCVNKRHKAIAVMALLLLLLIESVWMQLGVVVLGMGAGCAAYWYVNAKNRSDSDDVNLANSHSALASAPAAEFTISPFLAKVLVGLFFILLFMLPVVTSLISHSNVSMWLTFFDTFYRTGALVFGGGHVVLPWLEQAVVGQQWLSTDAFLAGYGATQAVPGPMFTFSAYLGALIPQELVLQTTTQQQATGISVGGALLAVFAVFLPGFLLLLAVLPVWAYLSKYALAKAGLAGVNAAVVGLLVAAWYNPIITSSMVSGADVIIVIAGFLMLRNAARSPLCSPLGVVFTCVAASILWSL